MSYYYKKLIGEFNLDIVNSEIETFCDQNDISANKLFSIQLIIEELVTNIIRYGKTENDGETIEITLDIAPDGVILQIIDNATAFNPLEVEDPDISLPLEERSVGGLGLFLVRKKVKLLSYEYRHGYNVVKAII